MVSGTEFSFKFLWIHLIPCKFSFRAPYFKNEKVNYQSGYLEGSMRVVRSVAGAVLVLVVFSMTVAHATSSPYPDTLTMQRGLFDPFPNNGPTWGTKLTTAQAKWVTLKSAGATYKWGVWKENAGSATYPVRSTDGGTNWMAAGPQLATDWAGGGIYYIGRVIPESPASVVMVNTAVIDVTTDSGHHWFQYLNWASDWLITAHHVSGSSISLRIGPANNSTLPKTSYAIYVLDVTHHQWHRITQSLH